MRIFKAAVVVFLVSIWACQGYAQDFNKGAEAYDKGDYAAALIEWRPLAEEGDARAQIMLGMAYLNGHGVSKDYSIGVEWFRLAAEQGHMRGQTALGMAYFDGLGVPKNYSEGVKWFHLAAEQGDVIAHLRLGSAYRSGAGVPQDIVKSYMWFSVAAAKGSSEAMDTLNRLVKWITPAGLQEAHRLADECIAKSYKDC